MGSIDEHHLFSDIDASQRASSSEITTKIIKMEINQLPPEMLEKILNYLPIEEKINMDQVCVKWRNIIASSWYATKKINLKRLNDNEEIFSAKKKLQLQIKTLRLAGKHVEELTVQIRTGQSVLLKYLNNCKNVKKIQLMMNNSDVVPIHFNRLFDEMPQLKSINVLDNFPYPQWRQNHDLMYKKIFHQLPEKINEIIISPTPCLTAPVVPRMTLSYLDTYQQLTRLTICHRQLAADDILAISALKQLDYLNLQGCKISREDCFPLVSLKNLTSLNIKAVTFFSINALIQLIDACPLMTNLNIASVPSFSPTDLYNIVRYNTKFENIGLDALNHVNSKVLSRLIDNCKGLKKIVIVENWGIDIPTLKQIPRLMNLEKLIIKNEPNATDEIFGKTGNLLKLRKVDCSGCVGVTDQGIQALLKKCKNLGHLNVVGTSITIETLKFAFEMERTSIIEIFSSVKTLLKFEKQLTFTDIHLIN